MHLNHQNVISVLIAVFISLCLSGKPAMAQSAGFGLRAGASVSPDQFFFGGHIQSGPIIPHLTFRPNLELGLGSNLTTTAVNLEFAYWIPLRGQPFDIYFGGGPALNIYSTNGNGRNTQVQGGFNFLAGLQHKKGLFGEIKVGAIDSPDFKLMIGYSFGRLR